jgi:uncharacterized protein (DUF302 family)
LAAAIVPFHVRPTTLLIFGNPKGGTPIMAAFPGVAVAVGHVLDTVTNSVV